MAQTTTENREGQPPNNGATSAESPRAAQSILVAVCGKTGTGKSAFISRVVGHDVGIGHKLRSCTSDVREVHCQIEDYAVTLVDTPGFDDTNQTDTDILNKIATWMVTKYGQKSLLSGLIYLYDITDERMAGSSVKNLEIFRALCGEENMQNVVLLSTKWDKVTRDPEQKKKAEEHESELCQTGTFWRSMKLRGAVVKRHDNSTQSAVEVIKSLVTNSPVALAIQLEICEQKKELIDTGAGSRINKELLEAQRKHKEELEAVKQELETKAVKRNAALKEELEENHARIIRDIKRNQEDQQRLNDQNKASLERQLAELRLSSVRSSSQSQAGNGISDVRAWQCWCRSSFSASYLELQKGRYCSTCGARLTIENYRKNFLCSPGCGVNMYIVEGIKYVCSCGNQWW